MNVALPPELEEIINRKVASGLYPTATDVIRAALDLLRRRDDQRQELLKEIAVGIEQANEGKVEPLTEELIEQIKPQGRERRRSNGAATK